MPERRMPDAVAKLGPAYEYGKVHVVLAGAAAPVAAIATVPDGRGGGKRQGSCDAVVDARC